MRYISTRGQAPELSFTQAMMTGLARDGGLYVPKDVPQMAVGDIAALAGKSYEDVAFSVIRPFIGDDFTDDALQGIIARAYAGFRHDARAPLVQLAPNHFLLELFHGPTLAFKDFAMQLIGQMMQAALARSGRPGDDRRRDLGRYRVGGDRGIQGAGQCRCVHPVPAWPGVGNSAPPDDDTGRCQCPRAGAGRGFRRLPGPAEGHVQRSRLSRRGAN